MKNHKTFNEFNDGLSKCQEQDFPIKLTSFKTAI